MNQFTIFLLKEGIKDFDEALDSEKSFTSYSLKNEFFLKAKLCITSSSPKIPDWLKEINPYLDDPVESLLSSNVSGLLLVEHLDRFFALSFGHGRHLLNKTKTVRDFGLKVTLNTVSSEKLRSIDSKTYEDLVKTTKQQTSQSTRVIDFDLDVSSALIKGVAGVPDSTDEITRICGAESLQVTTPFELNELADLLDLVFTSYGDSRYLENFGWIDRIREVDPIVKGTLDDLLLKSLSNRKTTAYLAPFDLLDWGRVKGFSYPNSPSNIQYPELKIDDYLEAQRKSGILTLESLKRHKVRIYDQIDEQYYDKWRVYDCLVWEVPFEGHQYVIFDGRWFQIDKDYFAEVSEYISSIIKENLGFDRPKIGENEDDYNQRVSENSPNEYLNLDKKLYKPSANLSPIEVCDIFSNQNQFIHVKKRSSSAALSHLFSQGLVSGNMFLLDSNLRKFLSEKVSNWELSIPLDRPNAGEYEVVFAIIQYDRKENNSLPFFSSVNAMHHAKRLQGFGFKVSIEFLLYES